MRVFRKAYSKAPAQKLTAYGANDVREGVAIMWLEDVDVSITGNSTNPTRFQHPVAGTYKRTYRSFCKKYFSVASGGGTGRTLHPEKHGSRSCFLWYDRYSGTYALRRTVGGSSSVPAHVEMMV